MERGGGLREVRAQVPAHRFVVGARGHDQRLGEGGVEGGGVHEAGVLEHLTSQRPGITKLPQNHNAAARARCTTSHNRAGTNHEPTGAQADMGRLRRQAFNSRAGDVARGCGLELPWVLVVCLVRHQHIVRSLYIVVFGSCEKHITCSRARGWEPCRGSLSGTQRARAVSEAGALQPPG